MTFNQLKYFYAVCKHNNISKAAEELYVSQPSVSVAIKELEEELHEKLFVRSNNKLYFTEAGNKLCKMAEDMLAHMELIEKSFRKEYTDSQKLKIGIFPDLIKWAFPYIDEITARLAKKYPQLDVEFLQVTTEDRNRLLANNYVDLVFCNEEYETPSIFGVKRVHRTEMKVCMSKEHPLAQEKTITPQMLDGLTFIGNYDTPEITRQWMEKYLEGTGASMKFKHFFLQNEAIHTLLLRNEGVSFGRPEMNGMSMDGIVALPLEKARYMNVAIMYDNRYNIRDVVADFVSYAPVV